MGITTSNFNYNKFGVFSFFDVTNTPRIFFETVVDAD